MTSRSSKLLRIQKQQIHFVQFNATLNVMLKEVIEISGKNCNENFIQPSHDLVFNCIFGYSECNAATCDQQLGYCRLGYYKGLNNASWINDNLSDDQKAMFHIKEYNSFEGLYVIQHQLKYKDIINHLFFHFPNNLKIGLLLKVASLRIQVGMEEKTQVI